VKNLMLSSSSSSSLAVGDFLFFPCNLFVVLGGHYAAASNRSVAKLLFFKIQMPHLDSG
jgi:hypothetical protein